MAALSRVTNRRSLRAFPRTAFPIYIRVYSLANVTLNLGTGSKLKNVAVLRQNLPTPTNFQTAMAAPNGVMQWFAENGNLTNVAVNGGSSGAGCQVGDVLQVPAPIGDFAWVQVATVTGGAANTVTVLNPGSYQTFPASPVTTRNPVNGPASHCTSLPQLTFTAGTPMSVGVLGIGVSYAEDVTITGFNTPLYASALTARNVQFDGANGVDITNNGTNGSTSTSRGEDFFRAGHRLIRCRTAMAKIRSPLGGR